MKYIEQHIAQVEIIFGQYKGQEPLHLFLKKHFKKYKKFGSRDRKNISECLYGVFRMGRENRHLNIRQRVYIFLFLKGSLPKDFFTLNFEELAIDYELPFDEKIKFLQEKYELRETFRTQEEISPLIDLADYRNSYYKEPLVFIRLRKGGLKKYNKQIKENDGVYVSENCISFPPQVKLELFLEAKDYVVQDLNSQRTAEYFPVLKKGFMVWDCCAGSGGKSILLLDKYPEIDLTVTDIRAGILRNLIERFKLYDVEAETIAELNVNKQKELSILGDQLFDFIICDVPCTGSGTWARTPEQAYYFEKKETQKFHKRQLDVLTNASSKIAQGGEILYISCSVFEKENEAVVSDFLGNNSSFQSVEQHYLNGTKSQSDTLFVARLRKN